MLAALQIISLSWPIAAIVVACGVAWIVNSNVRRTMKLKLDMRKLEVDRDLEQFRMKLGGEKLIEQQSNRDYD